ncbi:hypothetical protein BH10PSE19_BH10PSE19_01790 [soil metagenome]
MATQKKKTTTKKVTLSPVSIDIQNLQNCIDKDYANLAKTYTKNLSGIAKTIASTKQALKKAKKKPAKSKISKGRTAKTSDPSVVNNLKNELNTLKIEQASLIAGHKKFVSQQKSLKQFEKAWIKQNKAATKKKKETKTAGATKPAKKKSKTTEVLNTESNTQV